MKFTIWVLVYALKNLSPHRFVTGFTVLEAVLAVRGTNGLAGRHENFCSKLYNYLLLLHKTFNNN